MIKYQTRAILCKSLPLIAMSLYSLPLYAQSPSDTNNPTPQPTQYQNVPQPSPPDAPDFGPYMADLQRRLKRTWFPPKGYEDKIVVVKFKVHRQGEISNLCLERSSGFPLADQAALKAVEICPFRPLPMQSPDSVEIQFTFDYNVFYGASGLKRTLDKP